MAEQEHIEKLVETLTDCLAELDRLGAHIAAAQVDSALHALRRQFRATRELSDTE